MCCDLILLCSVNHRNIFPKGISFVYLCDVVLTGLICMKKGQSQEQTLFKCFCTRFAQILANSSASSVGTKMFNHLLKSGFDCIFFHTFLTFYRYDGIQAQLLVIEVIVACMTSSSL